MTGDMYMDSKEKGELQDSSPLTPEQVENWRKVLLGIIGPYALIMPTAKVQAMRDAMQSEFDRAFDAIPPDNRETK